MLSKISPELASTHSPPMSILYSRTSSAFGASISWPCICLSSFNVLLRRPHVRSGFAATHTPNLPLFAIQPVEFCALCRGCLVPRLTRASNLLVLKTLFEISDLWQPDKGRELPKRQQPIFR